MSGWRDMSNETARKVAQLLSGAPVGRLTPLSKRYAKDEGGRIFMYTEQSRYEAAKKRRAFSRDKRHFAFGHIRHMREITNNLSKKYCGYILLIQPHIAFKSNVLVKEGREDSPLTIDDLARIWNVSKRTARAVISELETRSIIFESSGRFTLNDRYHFRKKAAEDVDALIKTYFTALKSFELTAADLGFVYKLLPYVHYETNTVCADPFASPEDLCFLNEREIAESVGMSEKEVVKILARLRKSNILRGYINVDNRRDTLTILNPYVFYRKKGEPDPMVLALFNQPKRE
jgi:DNA-binding Lrp family transcriptional regulator